MLNISVILLILWLLAVFAFQMTSPLIYILLIASAITLVAGLLRRRR